MPTEQTSKPSWILADVRDFARAAHERVVNPDGSIGQKRKYTGEPYFVHPMEVASIVASRPATQAMVAAAMLHDTVEDTDVTIEQIRELFGDEVADLVYCVTDILTPADGNRKFRNEFQNNRLAQSPGEAQSIKLGDIISNCGSIVRHDPKYGHTYLREKMATIKVLTRADPVLLAEATRICEEGLVLCEYALKKARDAQNAPKP